MRSMCFDTYKTFIWNLGLTVWGFLKIKWYRSVILEWSDFWV